MRRRVVRGLRPAMKRASTASCGRAGVGEEAAAGGGPRCGGHVDPRRVRGRGRNVHPDARRPGKARARLSGSRRVDDARVIWRDFVFAAGPRGSLRGRGAARPSSREGPRVPERRRCLSGYGPEPVAGADTVPRDRPQTLKGPVEALDRRRHEGAELATERHAVEPARRGGSQSTGQIMVFGASGHCSGHNFHR